MVSIICAVRALVFGFYRNVFSFRIKVSLKTLQLIFVHFVKKVNKRCLYFLVEFYDSDFHNYSFGFSWSSILFNIYPACPLLGRNLSPGFCCIWRNFILWPMSTKCIIHMLSHCSCNRQEVCHLTSSDLDFL